MREKMKGPVVSNAASYARRQMPTLEEFDACYEYEYLDEVPQPYRDIFQQVIEWQLRGGKEDEMPSSPMPSFKHSGAELAALYKSSAEAKGITVRALAIKGRVSQAYVRDFYDGRIIPLAALKKIKQALKEFGIAFGV